MLARNNGKPHGLLGNTFILLLAGIVMICVAAILPAIWVATKEFSKAEAAHDPRNCLSIREDSARLSCFEERIKAAPSQPAKGALAPIGIFSGTGK